MASPPEIFRALHTSGCFVLPNPWDIGSAKLLASLGYRALATTSAGYAFSCGLPDVPTALGLEQTLANLREIVGATNLPVNADFQAGYGQTPDELARSVSQCVQTGVAGLSIEDATGDKAEPLYPFETAVQRVRAARKAIDASGSKVVLTARAECFLVGHPDPLAESIRRLVAYAECGADCLYAPGLRTPEEVDAVVRSVAPKPVNVLAVAQTWMSLATLREVGVRRISIGSAFARIAWGGFLAAAREVAQTGQFTPLHDALPFAVLNDLFASNAD